MTEEGASLRITRDLKAAVSAILRSHGDGQGPVTDASAELHRLCGCLELLLQFDQKEQRSFLGPRKGYWDFLCTALQRQRGDAELTRFVCSQDKLKTALGKGRAFIRCCLARGQLAESLQLCLLSPELSRAWYGPRSPLLCPELKEDILDSLYTLNGVAFNLDLQRPDLDEAWPMFSESRCSNPSRAQGRRARKTKDSPKEIASGGPRGAWPREPHTSQASCQRDAPRTDLLPGSSRSQQHGHFPSFLEKKKEDSRSLSPSQNTEGKELPLDQEEGDPDPGRYLETLTASIQQPREGGKEAQTVAGMEAEGKEVLLGIKDPRTTEAAHRGEAEQHPVRGFLACTPQEMTEEAASGSRQGQEGPGLLQEFWALQDLEAEGDSTTEKSEEQTGVAKKEELAELSLQDMVKSLRQKLQRAEEQAQRQEQLLQVWEGERQALQEQLSRCQGESARLQTQLDQQRREAERRGAMYEEELRRQQDLVQAMKKRVLELIHEKDQQWQRLQRPSTVGPGCCVGCGKVFGRLSRRYPCRICRGLVCHACSADYKKRERCCPLCAQGGAQVT
ncbi:RUN and FYVE domain-containing protein 4 [Perognathus longimembris pacificus]|uniref:RUN and FYVE domain-containing protein 4 n=1 Tax=Perognathus longimembris pacificus TaxID=214514 RepID=UPI002019619A|nr:RUN and FYVE domain-containing protein 4 [Perognathus longimembris pacificus]